MVDGHSVFAADVCETLTRGLASLPPGDIGMADFVRMVFSPSSQSMAVFLRPLSTVGYGTSYRRPKVYVFPLGPAGSAKARPPPLEVTNANWTGSVIFSADSSVLFTASLDKVLRAWRVESGEALYEIDGLPCGGHHVDTLRLSPHGKFAVSSDEEHG